MFWVIFFWKFSFFGLLKHYKNRGFSNCWGFLLLKEKKVGKTKMISEIYEFWFFWSKNGRFVTHICFPKKGPETPIFIVFLGARFLGQGVKKGKFWKATPKKRKNWLITEKLILGIFAFLGGFFFLVFLFFLLFSLFLFLFLCLFWRV